MGALELVHYYTIPVKLWAWGMGGGGVAPPPPVMKLPLSISTTPGHETYYVYLRIRMVRMYLL